MAAAMPTFPSPPPGPMRGPTVPGLWPLSQVTTVNIHQTSSGYNGNNYTVLSEGEPLLTMNEEVPDTFCRGGPDRGFIFDGIENTGEKVFRFVRPSKLLYKSHKVQLFIDDQLVNYIRLESSFLTTVISIMDHQKQKVLRLKEQIADTVVFHLQTNDKTRIGSVRRKWKGGKKELNHKNDFIVTFPAELALQYKIAVIVACVYIDFKIDEGEI